MALDTSTFEGRPVQYPDGNPKTALGLAKVPMRLIPASARIQMALGFKDGARKYGPYNWREKGVTASVYIDAAQRHIDAWFDSEAVAPDSGVHHLGHAMASLAIIVDAEEVGKLNDDRPLPGTAAEMQRRYQDPIPAPADETPLSEEERLAAALAILGDLGFELVTTKSPEGLSINMGVVRRDDVAKVRDPSFFNDPVRALLAARGKKNDGDKS